MLPQWLTVLLLNQSEQADQVMRPAKSYRSFFELYFEIFLSALLRVKARRIVIRSLARPVLALC